MAGLDDYQFYSNLREKDSPFWQRNIAGMEENEMSSHSLVQEQLRSKPGAVQEVTFEKDPQAEKYEELSINLVCLCAENLLSHPFIVVRRQCQVNVSSNRYHLFPVTLIPALIHVHRCYGLTTLWRGLGSVLIVRGVTMGLEDFVSKITPWPKEISPHSSLHSISLHLLLKAVALAITTPFYSASLVETVQSEAASEAPGVLDVFREGVGRLVSFMQPQTGRMLPVWILIVPTVTYGISHYVIGNSMSTLASYALRRARRQDQERQGAVSKDSGPLFDASTRLQAAFIGHMISDVILYPLETILHRLHMQGTRTIIDSLDVGYEVKPILTRYEGFWDCLHTSIAEEGISGLFKGFGALCLQYALYGAVLKFAHVIIREVSHVIMPPKVKAVPRDLVSPLARSPPYPPQLNLRSSPIVDNSHQFMPRGTPRILPIYDGQSTVSAESAFRNTAI